jgi:hypothetical protein
VALKQPHVQNPGSLHGSQIALDSNVVSSVYGLCGLGWGVILFLLPGQEA